MPSPESIRYKLLTHLESNPEATQRELARELGISLGKVNYCLRALIAKGWVKAGRFCRSPDKRKYAYLLTPHGLEARARVTAEFLQKKREEYESLRQEIEHLSSELQRHQASKGKRISGKGSKGGRR